MKEKHLLVVCSPVKGLLSLPWLTAKILKRQVVPGIRSTTSAKELLVMGSLWPCWPGRLTGIASTRQPDTWLCGGVHMMVTLTSETSTNCRSRGEGTSSESRETKQCQRESLVTGKSYRFTWKKKNYQVLIQQWIVQGYLPNKYHGNVTLKHVYTNSRTIFKQTTIQSITTQLPLFYDLSKYLAITKQEQKKQM